MSSSVNRLSYSRPTYNSDVAAEVEGSERIKKGTRMVYGGKGKGSKRY